MHENAIRADYGWLANSGTNRVVTKTAVRAQLRLKGNSIVVVTCTLIEIIKKSNLFSHKTLVFRPPCFRKQSVL